MSSSGKLLTTAFRHGAVLAEPTTPVHPTSLTARDNVPWPLPTTRPHIGKPRAMETLSDGEGASGPMAGNGMEEVFSIRWELALVLAPPGVLAPLPASGEKITFPA